MWGATDGGSEVGVTGADGDAGAGIRGRRLDWLIVAVLFVLSIAVRLGVVHSSGGFEVLNGYDDGVYFAATNGLLHGLVPYRDFVLLHPPGIMVLGAGPVAVGHALGMSDVHTLVLVRALFVCLGGLNTALMFLAGRHLSRPAGVVAASLYAVWTPVVREERTMLLEPFVILGILAALVLVPPISNRVLGGRRWRPVVAGAVGGVAVTTKLWVAVPLAVIACGLLVVGRWRTALGYCASVAVTALAVAGPFLMMAPSQMWNMVVVAQAGRPSLGDGRLIRLGEMSNLLAWPLSALVRTAGPPMEPVTPLTSGSDQAAFFGTDRAHLVVAATVLLVLVLCVLVARRLSPARIWVALLVVQSVLLLATPAFFGGYPSFVAPAGLLVVGAGAHLVWASPRVSRSRVSRGLVVAGLAVGVVAMGWGAVMTDRGRPISNRVTRILASARCVAADSPTTLVLTNRLSANLANGCQPVFDFTGTVYTLAYGKDRPRGPSGLRKESAEFQQWALDYFAGSDYVVLRRRVSGLTEETMAVLQERPLVRSGFPRVYGPVAGGSAGAGSGHD